MKATVSWQQALTFSGKTESGFSQTLDGNGETLSPMETVLLAVGACSSIDVVDILKKTPPDHSRLPMRVGSTACRRAAAGIY